VGFDSAVHKRQGSQVFFFALYYPGVGVPMLEACRAMVPTDFSDANSTKHFPMIDFTTDPTVIERWDLNAIPAHRPRFKSIP
jgi:hypothetical protein